MSANPGGKKRAEAAGEDPHPRRRISECSPDGLLAGVRMVLTAKGAEPAVTARSAPPYCILYTDASRKDASLQKQNGDVNKSVFRVRVSGGEEAVWRLGGGALACVRAPRALDRKPDGGQESHLGASWQDNRLTPLSGYNRGVFPAAEGRIRGNSGDRITWKEGYS